MSPLRQVVLDTIYNRWLGLDEAGELWAGELRLVEPAAATQAPKIKMVWRKVEQEGRD